MYVYYWVNLVITQLTYSYSKTTKKWHLLQKLNYHTTQLNDNINIMYEHVFVTGFGKTEHLRSFIILRNINLKYSHA